jgi:hypothetical protein
VKDQFEIWTFDFPERGGAHPCVLISHPDIAARAKWVNILYCTSQRQSRPLRPYEVLLNGADGRDWETFCDCSILFIAESARLYNKMGTGTLPRRNQIRNKIRDSFLLAARD